MTFCEYVSTFLILKTNKFSVRINVLKMYESNVFLFSKRKFRGFLLYRYVNVIANVMLRPPSSLQPPSSFRSPTASKYATRASRQRFVPCSVYSFRPSTIEQNEDATTRFGPTPYLLLLNFEIANSEFIFSGVGRREARTVWAC